VLAFPRGSTPIDFAYAVHTEVGHRCIGAKVNGRLVPLDYKLESGDAVEVVTSKAQTAAPHRDWLKVVRTTRARNKIRQWFSRERREDAIEKGRDDLVRALRKTRMPIKDVLASNALRGLASELKFPTLEAMEAAIGDGHLSAQHVVQRLQHELGDDHGPAETAPPPRPVRLKPPSETGVVVPGVEDILVRLARCCTPVPGDGIIGFITRGRGISVHRGDCPNAKALTAGGERMVEVGWDTSIPAGFTVSIQVEALDRQKLLRDVTTAISDLGVNIMSTSSNTNPRTRVASLRFTMELADAAHLDHILSSVKRVDGVYDAFRVIPGRGAKTGPK
jgi:GTP pyrophosphokinase